jgi:hypothetical protein
VPTKKKRREKLTPVQVIARFEVLKTNRTNWESHWQECADFFLPNRNDVTTTITPGQKRNLQLLDSTGVNSNELLAGALHGMLTSPTSLWFSLTTGIPEIDRLDDVREWLAKHTLKMHNVLNNSNFQTEVHQYYLDLTGINTACLTTEEDDERVVRFSARHIKELYCAENNKGIIDEVYRPICWNIRQIVGEFGEEVLEKSENLKRAWTSHAETKFEIIHAVYPRDPADDSFRDLRRFVSQYVLKQEVKGGVELSSGFYREFPHAVSRWVKCSGETYGRGPAMNALPDAKVLNKMTETMMIGAQRAADPPLQAPDDGFVLPLVTRPGGLNYYRAGSQDRVEPIFADTRIDFGFQAMAERRTRIREAFYVDQLQLGQGPQMTATEVTQRTEEKMRLLGPMLGRQQSEFLRPLIDRVFEIMARRGMIEEAPQVLKEMKLNLDVTYSSVIAKAQRVNEAQNVNRTMQAIAPFVSLDQTVADNLNGDEAVRVLAEIYGLPVEMIRKKKDVEQVRETRAKAQQAQIEAEQQAQGVEQFAKAAPAAAKLQAA